MPRRLNLFCAQKLMLLSQAFCAAVVKQGGRCCCVWPEFLIFVNNSLSVFLSDFVLPFVWNPRFRPFSQRLLCGVQNAASPSTCRYSAALFTTSCIENSKCNNGAWFFVVVVLIGICVSLFFLVSSSKPKVSFFNGALQVVSLYFQICEFSAAAQQCGIRQTFFSRSICRGSAQP
jgi:hypothetical protein